jgi:hypothetical protein
MPPMHDDRINKPILTGVEIKGPQVGEWIRVIPSVGLQRRFRRFF